LYAADADLVQEATQGTKDERESVRNKLESQLFEELEKSDSLRPEYFRRFYPLAKNYQQHIELGPKLAFRVLTLTAGDRQSITMI
jgi:hypothetical protein